MSFSFGLTTSFFSFSTCLYGFSALNGALLHLFAAKPIPDVKANGMNYC
jgi:hypothetical protein